MRCKDCNACEKGFFKSKPDKYVCIGVSEPFVIEDINNGCTEYPDNNESELWSWNETDDDYWRHGTFDSKEEALKDAIAYIECIKGSLCSDIPVIYIGKCAYVPLRTDVDVERVLEYLDEAYCEDTLCEDYIYENVTNEQLTWLENKFSEVMKEFHKMAGINPGYYDVTDIEEIDLRDYIE